MNIIIAGAGEVGFHLAKLLTDEAHDIILVDTDPQRLTYIENQLDVLTVNGEATSFNVLKNANVAKADLLIAVTSYQEANIATTSIGKQLGAKKTIARISNTEFLTDKGTLDLTDIGVDELISPESLAAREIKRLLRESAATDTFEFEEGKLSIIGIQIEEKGPIVNKTMSEAAAMSPENDFTTVAIHRDNSTIIPKGDTKFLKGDHAYFIVHTEDIDKLIKFTGKERLAIRNIMVLGGSKTGIHAAKKLSNQYNVKLIEKDNEKSFRLADELDNVLVINGDGTDVDLLASENVKEMDAFVSVTGNSETNILSCLVAKNKGVKKTVAMVENIEYINLSQSIGIDTLINKKLIAASFIFRYIRKGDVVSLTGLHGIDAEVVEYKVKEKSKITTKKLSDLDFPPNAIVGGVVRNGDRYIASGDFKVQPGDRVIVFTLHDCANKVEKFF